jgi:hypothetical protein
MIIALRANEYLPSANVDSASAAKHRRFPMENRQSRCFGKMKEKTARFSGGFSY